VDASAVVRLASSEPESEALERSLANTTAISSAILAVEVHRAIRRHVDEPTAAAAAADAVLADVILAPLRAEVLGEAKRVGPPALRAIDALHLATALLLRPPVTAFVAYDGRLLAAARDAGLTVASPGAP
jgi:predicted nucleic acid-binding protein